MAWLQASGLCKRYGGVHALDRADFDLQRGEVHVLIGANGSGKSTLCKCLAGAVAPDEGRMSLDDRTLRLRGPADAEGHGIGVFYQELSLIPQLSVAQNIFLDREPRNRLGLVDEVAMRRAARTLMARFTEVAEGLRADRLVADLSPDQRQIVEILKVLARRPPVILFDEATAALDRRQVETFFAVIGELRAAGHGIVFISHRMDELFAIGDRITVLRDGQTVATVAVAETTREAVVAQMVGDSGVPAEGVDRTVTGAGIEDRSVLEVTGVAGVGLAPVTFSLRAGEILGLGGLHGQGQSPLLRGLFGASSRTAGTVRDGSGALALRRPADAVQAGIAYVSGDRSRDGIYPARNVFENLVSALLTRGRHHLVRPGRLREPLDRAMQALRTKFAGYSAPVTSLSGGNQQKVVIGRWLATGPRVLLLDDPTKGIDLSAKADLYAILRELTAEGVGVVFYSSDDAELLNTADRVLVFNGGRVVEELAGETLNRTALYRAAYGGEAE